MHRALNLVGRHFRLQEDMARVDLVATLVDKLYDVIAKLRLHYLRHLLRVGEVERHGCESRVEHATPRIAQLTALTGRNRVL